MGSLEGRYEAIEIVNEPRSLNPTVGDLADGAVQAPVDLKAWAWNMTEAANGMPADQLYGRPLGDPSMSTPLGASFVELHGPFQRLEASDEVRALIAKNGGQARPLSAAERMRGFR